MKNIIIKKSIAILMLLLILISMFTNYAHATEISTAYIYEKGKCELHLQYWKESSNIWSYVTCTYVVYNQNGVEYPAYCLNSELPGVGETDGYTVNIESLLDNVQIWRIIINGYPYKTPAEMGVYDEYDAFLATKQAIYCILNNFDARTRFRGGDERGTQIANAICNLVDIGRNGTQTPYTEGVAANKIGDFYEDGEYYSQEYSVNASVDISQYTITNTLGLPNGGLITDMLDNQKSTFSGGEHFKVKIPKEQLSDDINVEILFQAKCKTYPVFYGKTTVAGTQNYAVTYDPFGDVAGRTSLNIKTNTGKIQINKTDSETSQPIEGVTFQLTKEDGTVVANATTNANGVATFSGLYPSNYKLVEISTSEDYVINSAIFDVNVEYNKTTIQNITNEHKKGNLKIYKVDKDNNKIALGNVQFDLYSDEFQKVIGTYTTNVDGEITINNLRTGAYRLIEKNTGKWYNLAEDTDIEIEWNVTNETTIENELKKGQVKVIKVDKDNNEIKLEGVKFDVLDENGNVLETITTDENGEALTSRYAIRDYSKLIIREKETLQDYALNDTPQTITLETDKIKTVTFENELIKGHIKIIKVSKEDNPYNEDVKGTRLKNAKFEVYDENNNLVDTLITDENGEAMTKELLKGKYKILEVDCPDYYILTDVVFNAEIVKHQEIVNIEIENENVDIDVEVTKKGFVETQSKDSIYYDFSNIHNKSNISLDNFTWSDSLPTNALRANRIYTGTWNENLTYSVWYKTNLSDDYIMLVDGLSTQINNEVKFTNVELKNGEFITDFEFRFGTVKADFKEIEQPRLYCDMLENLPNGFIFVNHTKVSGNYKDVYVEDKDDWKTITYYKEIELTENLPKTGSIDYSFFIAIGIILLVNGIVLILMLRKKTKNIDNTK